MHPYQVIDLVVRRLDDTWIEVQQKAGEVLSGMLHCHFIQHPLDLMVCLPSPMNSVYFMLFTLTFIFVCVWKFIGTLCL